MDATNKPESTAGKDGTAGEWGVPADSGCSQ